MFIKPQDLDQALAKAAEVSHHYNLHHLGANDPQKRIDYLFQSCAPLLQPRVIRILESEIDFAQSAVYSMCVLMDDKVDIVLAKDLNLCWRRYTVCKEVFHVLLDSEEHRNLDIASVTEGVSVVFPSDDAHASPAVAAEFLAEIAAMEFLFPYVRRVQELAAPGAPNFKDIALKYRIPQKLVEKYLTANFIANLQGKGPQA